MKNEALKRILAMVMVIAMCLSLCPTAVFADDIQQTDISDDVTTEVVLSDDTVINLSLEDPDAPPVNPEGTPVDPEGSPVDPDDSPVDPDDSPVDPDDSLVDPDDSLVDPDDSLVDPESSPVDSDNSLEPSIDDLEDEEDPFKDLSEEEIEILLRQVRLYSGYSEGMAIDDYLSDTDNHPGRVNRKIIDKDGNEIVASDLEPVTGNKFTFDLTITADNGIAAGKYTSNIYFNQQIPSLVSADHKLRFY